MLFEGSRSPAVDTWLPCPELAGSRDVPRSEQNRRRHMVQELCEALLLDDAALNQLDFKDLNAFFELVGIGSGDGRYKDVKYAMNGLRILLTNELNYDGEPSPLRPCTPKDFWAMAGKIFGHLKDVHLYALFKRNPTIIGRRHALYVRPPSEDPLAPVLRYTNPGIKQDWLKPDRKEYLSKYRLGIHVSPGYGEATQAENA